MFEKEAEEYANGKGHENYENTGCLFDFARLCFQDGAAYGYNKALEEWKKCFLSCSSPFCSKHFPTVESSGVLGNMEKKEK